MPTTVAPSGNQDIDGVLWGWKWISTDLTYSFPTDTSSYGSYVAVNGLEALNANQQTAAERAMANVASFTNLTFTESTGDTTLRFAEADSIDRSFGVETINTAKGTPPDPNFAPSYAHGDMWFNHTNYNNPALGSFAYACGVMHELGHALGLKHGHTEQVADHDDHEHDLPALPADHDSLEYSVMTYRAYPGADIPGGNTIIANDFPQTFMMNDISTLQYLYGANYNFNSGNTTYSWSQSTGEMSIDGVGQGAPTENEILLTIWDGGGIDTYDFSNYTSDLVVSLAPGEWSTASESQLADLGGQDARGNIANARLFEGNTASLIENAYGGSGDDVITGNQGANALKGGGGADTLAGLEGDDLLVGEDGDDNLKGAGGDDYLYGGDNDDSLKGGGGADYLNGGNGIDTADYSDSTVAVSVYLSGSSFGGTAEGDTYSQVENVVGSAYDDWLTGDASANELEGGSGDDVLHGRGGADTLRGGAGLDTAYYAASAAGVSVSLSSGTGLGGDAEGDTLFTIENVTGSQYDDLLVGNNSANTLSGMGGQDTLKGGGGADSLFGGLGNDTLKGGGGADTLNGSIGTDTASYAQSTAGVTVSLLTDVAFDGDAEGDELDSIENLTGSGHADTLWGDDGVNALDGAAGDDIVKGWGGADSLQGGADDDTLFGGTGNDAIGGGAGSDSAYFAGNRATYTLTNLGGGDVQTSGADGVDMVSGVEELVFDDLTFIWAPNRANDFNADGVGDILWRNDDGTVATWELNGAGGFSYQGYGGSDAEWSFAASGDFNFDGVSDVLWRNTITGEVTAWELDGAGGHTAESYGAANLVWEVAGSGDFNADGISDVLWRNTSTGQVATWELDGAGGFAFNSYGATGLAWDIAGSGDFNSDGRGDILWRNTATGQVATWELDGDGGTSFDAYGAANLVWEIAGSADFDGDAHNDILWRNMSNGQVATWELDGAGGFGFDNYGAAGLVWDVASAGDFNSDGNADIMFRNTGNGQVAAWELDGAGGFDYQGYGAANTTWSIFNSFDLA